MKKKILIALSICLIAVLLLALGLYFLPGSSNSQEPIGSEVNENGYYCYDGHISRVESPMDQDSIDWAGYVFSSVRDMYLEGTDTNVYFAMIPDKNMFLAPEAGVEHLDYEAFYEAVYAQTDWMETIELRGLLSLSDYYASDSHWHQESILDVAEHILASMGGGSLPCDYVVNTASDSFTGAYHKQYPDYVETETLEYISSPGMESFIVRDATTGKRMELYDLSLAQSSDPYSMFLSGAMSIITIENPNAETDRELIIFRDSFGSAIAPLLAQGYAKTTVIDLRYITAAYMGNFVSFDDQDVLFLYSTLLLNSSAGLKR